MSRIVLSMLAGAVALVSTGAIADAAPGTSSARLEGEFKMSGKVTTALHVPGEHRGKHVVRMWVFTPRCATGACKKVTLVRTSGHGRDRLVLRRRKPGYYTGTGVFDAPARCGGKTYKRGIAVPLTITVRITGAASSGGTTVATALKATYRSRARANRTPCVKLPQRDAATYRGKLVTLTPPPGAP